MLGLIADTNTVQTLAYFKKAFDADGIDFIFILRELVPSGVNFNLFLGHMLFRECRKHLSTCVWGALSDTIKHSNLSSHSYK